LLGSSKSVEKDTRFIFVGHVFSLAQRLSLLCI